MDFVVARARFGILDAGFYALGPFLDADFCILGPFLGADFCILALILDADFYKIIARFGKPHLIIETSSTDTRNVIIQMLRAHVADYRRTIGVLPFLKKIRHIQCHSRGKIVLLHPRAFCTPCKSLCKRARKQFRVTAIHSIKNNNHNHRNLGQRHTDSAQFHTKSFLKTYEYFA